MKNYQKLQYKVEFTHCSHIIILGCSFLDSSKPIQKKISVNQEGLSTPITKYS